MRKTTALILMCSAALASGLASVEAARSAAQQPGGHVARGAYLTDQPPAGLEPARNLSADARRDNFEALWQIIDTAYAGFSRVLEALRDTSGLVVDIRDNTGGYGHASR